MDALYNVYRPHKFEDVVAQKSIVSVLQQQIKEKKFKNCYLFCGSSGCGKTTIARILANEINNGVGNPIEIDAASNNGVDSIRELVASASERALDCEYKVIIIDECHALTNQSWQAFLKCIEEPPKYTIFMFCTTDPQKVPATITNRVMKFTLTKIPTDMIRDRLQYICEQEHYTNYNEAIDYISKMANGGMRDAIALLDKASAYNTDLSINNVLDVLGNFSYRMFFDLTNGIIDGLDDKVISIVDELYDKGQDLRLFIEQYLEFVLDLFKYSVFGNLECLKIPQSFKDDIIYVVGEGDSRNFFSKFVDRVLGIKNTIKYDTNIKPTIEVLFIQMCRGI